MRLQPDSRNRLRSLPRYLSGGAKTLLLLCVVLVTSCVRLSQLTGDNFSHTASATYSDKDGKPLSQWTPSFDQAAAPYVEYEGKRYQTPAGKKEQLVLSLKPIAPDGKHPLKLRLPVDRRSAFVTGWTGLKLADGKVFIAGGCIEPSTNATDRAWLFDPATSKVSEECDLQVARSGEQLTLLCDGRVFISGGCPSGSPSAPLASWEVYDPASHDITLSGPMCRPRDDHGVVQLNNGDIFICGGHTTPHYTQADIDLTKTAEILKLSTGKSHIAGKLLMASTNPIVIPYGPDQAVVIGGFHENSRGDYRWIHGAETFDGERR